MRIVLIILLLVIISVVSCNQGVKQHQNLIHEQKASTIKYANFFELEKSEKSIFLKVFSKDKSKKITYRLSKTDTSKNTIKIPLQKIICMSSTHATFINSFDKSDVIKAISGVKYINDSILKDKILSNEIVEIGYESSLNYERIIEINPDVIFAYDIGDGTSNAINKLKELGFTIVIVTEFLENSPLAKAEWLKFFAAFLDCSDIADSIFANTEKEYIDLVELVSNIDNKPNVISSIPLKNVWYIPGSKSYFYKLINDAGANFIINNNDETGSVTMNFENVLVKSIDADFWLNLELVKSKNEIISIDERLTEIKAYKENRIYNNDLKSNENGGNSYWEEGTIYPQYILRDLINIFHPDLLNDSLTYYRKM